MRIQRIDSNYNIKNYNRISFKNKPASTAVSDAIAKNTALKKLKIGEKVYEGGSTLEIVKRYLTYMLQLDMVEFRGVGDTPGRFGIIDEEKGYYPFKPDDDLWGYMDIRDYFNLVGDLYSIAPDAPQGEIDHFETIQDLVNYIEKYCVNQ